ncbi:methionyl-tRNA formyltransferase [Candidatus Saccharibacteria bacterium]|nr:methionyl-tRNA formyltransferase [Candidatus Saccharibacteria bacterium]
MEKIIFLGNGPLADAALAVLQRECQVIFHARTKADLQEVKRIKRETPEAHGVLASFGVMIKEDVLALFEPEGILNIHPSLLPRYRGASPIESAILAGDSEFSVSVMKLAKAMDAGPIYYQTTLSDLPLNKATIYQALAEAGAEWICAHLNNLPEPTPQDDAQATFCGKLEKSMGLLTPTTDTAMQCLRKIVAFYGFPKAKYAFFGVNCIILEAHLLKPDETAPLILPCADGQAIAIDRLQPEGRKAMDAKAFLNGYQR